MNFFVCFVCFVVLFLCFFASLFVLFVCLFLYLFLCFFVSLVLCFVCCWVVWLFGCLLRGLVLYMLYGFVVVWCLLVCFSLAISCFAFAGYLLAVFHGCG